REFKATVQGVGVLIESAEVDEHLIEDYISVAKLTAADPKTKQISVIPGNYFDERGTN
ncbi:MAG: purine operon repressor, partial [Paenibacillus sp.]|nr:purine operon repressor [Paenibacillus sp.]